MTRFLRLHGLSLVLTTCFLILLFCGQLLSGWRVHNEERAESHLSALPLTTYVTSAHFVAATMENWESEFLQIFVYVFITAFLFQKGSAESNDPDKPRETRSVTTKSPWPVRRGGWWKAIYSHSLSGAFALLFGITFWLHASSSTDLENEHRLAEKLTPISIGEHLFSSQFWFESFQNWQSEFLAIASMVLLSIFLRERNSPESKPVEAPHFETGA